MDCIDLFILDGQGSLPSTAAQALQDAARPLANTILAAAHHSFLAELDAFSVEETTASGIHASDFPAPESLLEVHEHARASAIMQNVRLYLTQILRYTSVPFVHPGPAPVGFSTGMLAALVIAGSNNIPALIKNATEMIRLAIWLGLRVQIYTSEMLGHTHISDDSWSLVLFGANREEACEAVDRYNEAHDSSTRVYISAVTTDTCMSISGHPDALELFKEKSLPENVVVCKPAAIHALYHSPELIQAKAQVIRDITRREIILPSYGDLCRPLRSTVTGEVVGVGARPLIEEIVDMILVQPVNFDYVVRALHRDISSSTSNIRIINIGPATALWRSVGRTLHDLQVDMTDWSGTPAVSPTIPERNPCQEPIAIIGMDVRFPGADNSECLWELLEKGMNMVSEIPRSRFSVTNSSPARTVRCKYGNFIDGVDTFDHEFFNISPREARSMDPQQRVLLQVAHHALDDAGYVPGMTPCFDPATVGVYVGAATNDYVQNLRADMDVYYSTGTLPAFLSGKLSYAFKFEGPSVVVDTACSSAIVAIYQACRALAAGDCNAAIAGGVNIISSPDMHLGLERAHLLSPTGQCKPWDATADGYCRAEGCGMFVLKRLSDAQAENDRILGVIRGAHVNQAARAGSITHPYSAAQIALLRAVTCRAGVHPHSVSVVEAHGTGTRVGDPVEMESIRAVFAVGRAPDNPLHVTTVKANIGHAEAASGAASLAKLLLMFRKGAIPATISLQNLNSNIRPLALDNTVVDTELAQWGRTMNDEPRLAVLNNFGAAGSNATLIVEEPPVRTDAGTGQPRTFVVGLGADSKAALVLLRDAYVQQLQKIAHKPQVLADFMYTAMARRQLHKFRVSASAESGTALVASLQAAPVMEAPEERGMVVFVFSGQGGQYMGMGSGLYGSILSFREMVDDCHQKLVAWGYKGVLHIINPLVEQAEAKRAEKDVEAYQVATFVLEYALARLWMRWGLQPDAVVGHSLGEFAALVVAGVIGIDDALMLVAERARLMFKRCPLGHTGMMAVLTGAAHGAGMATRYEGLTIACDNSPSDCVVAGDLAQLAALQANLHQYGVRCVRLDVPYAYHTPTMTPIVDELRQLACGMTFSAPTVPVLSNVLGAVISAGDTSVFNADYVTRHCVGVVKLSESVQDFAVKNAFAAPATFLEIGAHPITLPALRSNRLFGSSTVYLASLRKGVPDWGVIGSALSSLFTLCTSISWRSVYADIAANASVIDLPPYPFTRTQFWVPFEEEHTPTGMRAGILFSTRFTLVDICRSLCVSDSGTEIIFETAIDTLSELILGHDVVGFALCPASVYLELALAATRCSLERLGHKSAALAVILSQIVYTAPLVYNIELPRTVVIRITVDIGDEIRLGQFEIQSYFNAVPDHAESHCNGLLERQNVERLDMGSSDYRLCPYNWDSHLKENVTTLDTPTVYDEVFSRVVNYSPRYRTIKSITISEDQMSARATIQVPTTELELRRTFATNPIFVDALLHVAGFVVNRIAEENEVFICERVGEVITMTDNFEEFAQRDVYCIVDNLSETGADADVFAFNPGDSISVIACLRGVRFRKIRLDRLQALFLASSKLPDSPCRLLDTPSTDLSGMPSPTTMTESWSTLLFQIIADTCGMSLLDLTAHPNAQLSDLGVDSLMTIELVYQLRAMVPPLHNLSFNALSSYNSLEDLISGLEALCGIILSPDNSTDNTLYEGENSPIFDVQDAPSPSKPFVDRFTAPLVDWSPIATALPNHSHHLDDIGDTCFAIEALEHNCILLQDGDPSVLPLILIHDGSGLEEAYTRLLPLDRRVWGIRNPKFFNECRWHGGVLEMARVYAAMISARTNALGCVIGGWSFGGVVAFEVARQLIHAGRHVSGVILIDSPSPMTQNPLPDEIVREVLGISDTMTRSKRLIYVQMQFASEMLVNYDPAVSPASHISPSIVMLRSREGFQPNNSKITPIEFLSNRQNTYTWITEWERLIDQSVPVFEIPGNHFQPFQPQNVKDVSERLLDALSLLCSPSNESNNCPQAIRQRHVHRCS